MVNVNIKKFSRSKTIEQDITPVDEHPIEDDNDFLSELHKDNYNKAVEEEQINEESAKLEKQKLKEREKEQKLKDKENEKLIKELEKKQKTVKAKVKKDDDTDSIFSDEGTKCLGKNRNILLKKVKQFKNLFPNELKTFKIKTNATEQELKNYLEEMEILVELNNVDDFLTDSIIQCIKVIENTTAHTKKYNITGLADCLKSNPQFISLCKQLYIKYNTFSSVPPEYQMIFLVSTTAYVCRNKNMQKIELEGFLNKEIII
jgi:hypothetical protein